MKAKTEKANKRSVLIKLDVGEQSPVLCIAFENKFEKVPVTVCGNDTATALTAALSPYVSTFYDEQVILLLPASFHSCEFVRIPSVGPKRSKAILQMQTTELYGKNVSISSHLLKTGKDYSDYLVNISNLDKIQSIKRAFSEAGCKLSGISFSAANKCTFFNMNCRELRNCSFVAVDIEKDRAEFIYSINGKYAGNDIFYIKNDCMDNKSVGLLSNAIAKQIVMSVKSIGMYGTEAVLIHSMCMTDSHKNMLKEKMENSLQCTVFKMPEKYRSLSQTGIPVDMIQILQNGIMQTTVIL